MSENDPVTDPINGSYYSLGQRNAAGINGYETSWEASNKMRAFELDQQQKNFSAFSQITSRDPALNNWEFKGFFKIVDKLLCWISYSLVAIILVALISSGVYLMGR